MRSQAKASSAGPTERRAPSGRSRFLAPILAVLALGLLPAMAQADFEDTGSFGVGVFSSEPAGIAVNRTSDELYVADAGNIRVERFDSEGSFISAWGGGVVSGGAQGSGDVNGTTTISNVLTTKKAFEIGQTITGEGIVPGTTITGVNTGTIILSQAATETKTGVALTVAEGAGNVPLNERQTITLDARAGAGTFALTFSTSAPSNTFATATEIPMNATAGELQAKLEALPNLGAGNVGVSGSAGGPWTVEFKGARFADTDVSQMSANASGLGAAIGAQLSCTGAPTGGAGATAVTFQWLANGAPATGTGANTNTYTVDASDAGKALQCRVVASHAAGAAKTAATQFSNTAIPVGNPTGPLPSIVGPVSAPTVEGGGNLTAAGKVLNCAPGTWQNATNPFAYQWYRNGAALSGNGADTSQYTVQAADVAEAAVFQCAVTASNASGSVTKASANRITAAPLPVPTPTAPNANATVAALAVTAATTQIAAAAAELCTAAADCKKGVSGTEEGQFKRPTGVAVDQNTGEVYVMDPSRTTELIQKFSPTGAHLSSFGERGSAAPEQIQSPTSGISFNRLNGIAVGPDGSIYVVDAGAAFGPRVAVFDSTGAYDRSLGAGTIKFPQSVALDDAGGIYVSSELFVWKLDSEGQLEWKHEEPTLSLEGMTVDPLTGEVFCYRSLPESSVFEELIQLDPDGNQVGVIPGRFGQTQTYGLAFNPELTPPGLPARPDGVLYAVDGSLKTGVIFAQSPLEPPVVKSQSTTSVGETSATLKATIDPKQGKTTYVFEYGTAGPCSSNPCTEAPVGGALLGSGKVDLTAGVTLTGLTPETTYHYRVIATSAGGSDTGEDRSFNTYPITAPGLPGGRAYEMVSPTFKSGGEVIPPLPRSGSCLFCAPTAGLATNTSILPIQASDDGEALAYQGEAFSGSVATGSNQYLAGRSSAGWQTTGLSSPLSTGGVYGFRVLSADLTRGVLFQGGVTLAPQAPAGYPNLYLWQQGGSLQPLVTEAPEHRAPLQSSGLSLNEFQIRFAGANSGAASAPAIAYSLFAANDSLTGATAEAPAAPDPGPGTTNFSLYEWVDGELALVNVLPGNATAATGEGVYFGSGGSPFNAALDNAISDDGSRIFWSDAGGQLYVRIDAAETRKVEDAGKFLTAAADGSTVLLDNGHIYDVDAETAVDLTGGEGGFQGILGATDDLSRLYFVDTAPLTPPAEENENGEHAEAGESNLYAWDEGAVEFVAKLLASDNSLSPGTGPYGAWRPRLSQRTAQVAPDGRYLAFTSTASITGYDNGRSDCTKSEPEGSKTHCLEVFVYDGDSDKLACASCNPTGERPQGRSVLGLIKGGRTIFAALDNLSDDGRVFFDSQDTLSPRDHNGIVQDVYQWKPDGVGGCEREQGCVSLISTGADTSDSYFLDATPSGNDVFFVTREQLSLSDRDDLLDVYDARVGGGIAAESETTRSECQGESCQPAAIVPSDPTPSSSSFSGAGNFKAPAKRQCRKGKRRVKRAGKVRCVKPKQSKRQNKRHSRVRANNNRGGVK